jgi:hypothetical protein
VGHMRRAAHTSACSRRVDVRVHRPQVRWLAESYASEEEAYETLCTLAATIGAVEAARAAVELQQREKEAQREREQQVRLLVVKSGGPRWRWCGHCSHEPTRS